MPLPVGSMPSAKRAQALLHAQRSQVDGLLQYAERKRHQRLQEFLEQHRAMGQWEQSCAALTDATRHGVRVQSSDVASVILCCGAAKVPETAKHLFYRFTRFAGIPRSRGLDEVFFEALAKCGDFDACHSRLVHLANKQVSQASASTTPPCVSTSVVLSYLDAALASHAHHHHRRPQASSRAPLPLSGNWAVALTEFVALRKNPATRPHIELTSQMLERVSRLAAVGGQWEAATILIASASAQQCLVPPESFDAAIRASYKAAQHPNVVALLRHCVASKTPPEEVCARMGLRSAEEVSASSALSSMVGEMARTGSNQHLIAIAAEKRLPTSYRNSEWLLSVKLFQGLCDNGLPLLPQTYEAPVRTCCSAGQWETAARIVAQMRSTDRRAVPTHLLRTVVLSKIECAPDITTAKTLFELPIVSKESTSSFLALLRCCMRLGDWRQFHTVHTEMKRRELPETFDTIKLLLVAAFCEEKWHSVVTRYVRWMQQTSYESERVRKDDVVPLHAADFSMEEELLRMTVHACDQLQDHRDVAVRAARADALRRLSGDRELLEGAQQKSTMSGKDSTLEPWLFTST